MGRTSTNEAISYLRSLGKPWLTPAEAARALNCDPQLLRISARLGTLNIDHQRCGNRLRIFTAPLIKKLGG